MFHYFVCYSSDGKEAWKSGTKEYFKVKLLNKLHRRFNGREKPRRADLKHPRNEQNRVYKGFHMGRQESNFLGWHGIGRITWPYTEASSGIIVIVFRIMGLVLNNFSHFIFPESLRQTFFGTL